MFIRHHWKALAWTLVIILACLLPGNDLPKAPNWFTSIPYYDKYVHAGLYFVFTLLLVSGFMLQYPGEKGKAYLLGGLVAFSIGIGIEFLQTLMHLGRTGDVIDAIANTTGIVLALLFFQPIRRLVPWLL